MDLYPFIFEPILKEKVWGGDRLGTHFDKPVAAGANIGESWEISDHPSDTSVIANGDLKGKSLHDIFDQDRTGLLGADLAAKYTDKFPLLIKFLDAMDDLSVQVHPTDEQAAELEVNELGKTECWYVLHADPGSTLIKGLSRDVSKDEFQSLADDNNLMDCMDQFEVKAGDFYFLPANTVHAIGAGILIAEIQQNSDTTYRVYDYDRPGLNGKPRELHIEKTLVVSDLDKSKIRHETPELVADGANKRYAMINCEKFWVHKLETTQPQKLNTEGAFHILMLLDGPATLTAGDTRLELPKGQSVLLPASVGEYTLDAGKNTVLLASAN